MSDLISRYIREYRDDAMTDPTMTYVGRDNFWTIKHGGRGLCMVVDGGEEEIVLQVSDMKWDDRTMLVSSVGADSEAVKESGIDLSSTLFYPVKSITAMPKMYEYQMTGVGMDGAVQFSEGVEVKCD
jgi:hypothetical protein